MVPSHHPELLDPYNGCIEGLVTFFAFIDDSWKGVIFPDICKEGEVRSFSFVFEKKCLSYSAKQDMDNIQSGTHVKFKVDTKNWTILDESIEITSHALFRTEEGKSPEKSRSESSKKFSKKSKIGQIVISCAKKKVWVCPWEVDSDSDEECCFHNDWYDSDEEETQICAECNNPKPTSEYCVPGGSQYFKDDNETWYKLLPRSHRPKLFTKEDARKFNEEFAGQHTTVEEILLIAEGEWDGSVEISKIKCPGCKTFRGNLPVGCHARVDHLKTYKFSEWYGLDNIINNRLKSLHVLLSKMPKCSCGLKAIPKAPNNVFWYPVGTTDSRAVFEQNRESIRLEIRGKNPGAVKYDICRTALKPKSDINTGEKIVGEFEFEIIESKEKDNMLCHVVPLIANGCMISYINIVPIYNMCATCQCLDALFTDWQTKPF
jgi:hypothetical protein